jgi:hypothetical protein
MTIPLALVDAHVIHQQLCRKNRFHADRTSHGSANGQVEDDKKWLFKHPFAIAAHITAGVGAIFYPIIEPADLILLPFDGIGVKIIGDIVFLPVPLRQAARAGITRSMQGAHKALCPHIP